MIEQNVQVVRCRDERLWIRMGSQSGCTACDNGQGCGAGLFAKLLQRKPVVIELDRNGLDVEAGQMVTLAFPEQVYVKLVLASYGWPLLAALAGAFAGHSLGNWLQFTPALIDVVTLACGLLAGAYLVYFMKGRKNPDMLLKCLHMAVCYPSETPHVCSGGRSSPDGE